MNVTLNPGPAIAFYARVSSHHQVQTGTIEQQLERLRDFASRQGWEIPSERVYRDDGYSGQRLARPGLDCLRDEVRAGRIERVLVTAPDRLARNFVQQLVLLEEFKRYGCQLEFLDRPTRTSVENGRYVFMPVGVATRHVACGVGRCE